MKKWIFLSALLCAFAMKAQQKPFDYNQQIDKLKKYLFAEPDSTKAIIHYILSQKNLNDTIKGNAYNIYGIYYDGIEKSDSALYYYKKAIEQLKDYPKIQTRPLMNISVIYRNRGDYDESFKYLDKALAINKKLGLRINQAVVYSNMSSNYQFMLEYTKAVEYCLKGIKIAKEENNTSVLVSLQQKLANTYLKMRNFDFAKEMYTECLQTFKSQHDDKNYYLTLLNFAEAAIQLEEYKEAKKALNEAIPGLEKFNSTELIGIAHSKLGSIANLEHNEPEALKHYEIAYNNLAALNSINSVIIASEYIKVLNGARQYNKALAVTERTKVLPIFDKASAEDKMYFELASADTYTNLNIDKKAISALNTAFTLKDSLAVLNDKENTKELQAKFQTQLQKEKNKSLAASNTMLRQSMKKDRKLMYLYIGISIAIIILILLFLRSYRLKARLKDEEVKAVKYENDLIKQQHEHEQELTNAQKEIIEEKQRELTSSTLRMANYQDNINEIITRCDSNIYKTPKDVKHDLMLLAKQKDYWKQFETRFNTLHPEFSNTLANRFAKLTKNDIEFCSLLKLNLSNKEIASLLQISHESAITKKYRIKKKMEITDDEEFEKLITEI